MILTVTGNPSLDLLFGADRLVWDDANRLDAPRRRPGGRGINLARAARALGGEAVAVAPLGGRTGGELRAVLESEGTPVEAVSIDGETRVFVGIREGATGRSLLLNPRGPMLTPDEARRLRDAAVQAIRRHEPAWVACCGSLAPGLPADSYARIGEAARDAGARFVPDCDGEALRLAADVGCDLLVPNAYEASRLLDSAIRSVDDAGEAAIRLADGPARVVCITLGGDGAVCAAEGSLWHADPPAVDGGSAVGAGDAFLAGLLLAWMDGADPPDMLRAGVAAGTATLLGRGDALVRAEDARGIAARVAVSRLR